MLKIIKRWLYKTNKLPKKHLVGSEFFRLPGLKTLNLNDYFKCLRVIRPLLKDSDYIKSTPGFYINYITNSDDDKLNSLRLTYYTIDSVKTLKIINEFVNKNNKNIEIFNSRWSSRPNTTQFPKKIRGEKLRFRNFLNTNTQIFLDVIQTYNIQSFRKTIFDYRHIYLPQRINPKSVFEPIFSKHSNYFNKLKKYSLDKQYWKDLVYYFQNKDPGLHFLVNMAVVQESSYNIEFFKKNWILKK